MNPSGGCLGWRVRKQITKIALPGKQRTKWAVFCWGRGGKWIPGLEGPVCAGNERLLQASVTPAHIAYNCSDWRGRIRPLVWQAWEPTAGSFQWTLKGTFFLLCINILLWLKLTLKAISLMNVVKSSCSLFSKLTFSLENGHESPGLALWIRLTCQVILRKSPVSSISLAVQWRTGLGDFQFSFWIKEEKPDSACSVPLPFECVYSLQENLKSIDQIY